MNDPTADETRRDRMAIAAASFCHPRVSDTRIGKKDQEADAAAKAGGNDTGWANDLEIDVRAN
jgi:phage terminase small subunit